MVINFYLKKPKYFFTNVCLLKYTHIPTPQFSGWLQGILHYFKMTYNMYMEHFNNPPLTHSLCFILRSLFNL